MAREGYRGQHPRELCGVCGELSAAGCPRCQAPLCPAHAPAAAVCELCETERTVARRSVGASLWNRVVVLPFSSALLGAGGLALSAAYILTGGLFPFERALQRWTDLCCGVVRIGGVGHERRRFDRRFARETRPRLIDRTRK